MFDSALALMAQGYAWLPDRRRRSRGKPVHCRLMGKNAVALHGPEAVRFFYTTRTTSSATAALPGPVLDTLFGRGAVHTLDDREHQVRKALFMTLLKDRGGLNSLAEYLRVEWDLARQRWAVRTSTLGRAWRNRTA